MRTFARRFVPLLFLAVVISTFVGAPWNDLLLSGAALASMVTAVVGARRMRGSSGWRLITAGGILIGIGPLFSGIPIAAAAFWSYGDLVVFAGYLTFSYGLERVLQVRTKSAQLPVALDSALLTAWLITLVLCFVAGPVGEALTGWEEVTAYSYLPFTSLLMVQLLRLLLAAPTRARSFVYLSIGVGAAVVSELLFLVVAGGATGVRPFALAAATAGLVLLAGAITDESAPDLENPGSGEFRSFNGLRAGLLVGSLFLFAGVAVSPATDNVVVAIGLGVICVLTSGRIYTLLVERDRWVAHERDARVLVASLMDAENSDDILAMATLAIERLLNRHQLVEVDFYQAECLESPDTTAWRPVEGDYSGNAQDGSPDLFAAAATQQTQQGEFVAGGRGKHATRLALPIGRQREKPLVLLVEALPVLEAMEISQIEATALNVRLAVESVTLREETHRRRSDSRFRALVQDSRDLVLLVNPETNVADMVGPTIGRLLGYDENDYIHQSPLQHLYPADRSNMEAKLAGLANADLDSADIRIRHANGDFRWFALSIRDLTADSEMNGLLYSFSDINDRKMAELQLSSSEGRYRSLVRNASDVFAIIDDEGAITFVSANVSRLLGFDPDELVGTQVRGLLTDRGAAEMEAIRAAEGRDLVGLTAELELRTASDEVRIAEVVFSELSAEEGEGLMITARDVTEHRRLEHSLRQQALYDPLTGLFNRASIYPELQRSLQRLGVGETVGVVHLNVCNFKEINESIGFSSGDELLISIAGRLRATLRGDDAIARMNADEFTVVTTGRSVGALLDFGGRLSAVFQDPFDIDGRQLEVTVALGIATTDDRRDSATTLLENAVLAVGAAQAQDKPMVLFTEAIRTEVAERFELGADLKGAIATDQFSLVFQPLFALDSNRVSSVEALLRWNHPSRGHISPGVFIPVAERTGSIVDLGRWVLERACEQLVDWHQNLPGGSGLGMGVNVSARQLEVSGEVDRLKSIIGRSGVDPSSLTLELTETTLIEDAVWLRSQLEEFRDLGVQIAVDDFGTGAAALSHLRDVPFDILKIDKSYIDNLEQSTDAANLVVGVIELAHGMNTKLVAEGIETPTQATLLREMNCDYGQGFYLGRPMDPRSLEEWFEKGRDGSAASLIRSADD